MFNWMPVAALIDDKIFCVHGGLSPDLTSLDQLTKLTRPTEVPNSGKFCVFYFRDLLISVKTKFYNFIIEDSFLKKSC